MFIVELKDIKDQGGFDIQNIREKFETCLNDFLTGVLSEFFINTSYVLKRIKLYFVTDPYKLGGNPSRARLNKGTKMDALLALNTKPYRFDGKRLGVEHSTVNPLITAC